MTSGRAQTLEWDAAGYRLRPTDAFSSQGRQDRLAARHQLPRGMRLSGETQAPRIDADGTGGAFSLHLALADHVAEVRFDGLQGLTGGVSR